MPQQLPRNLQEAEAMGGKPVVPRTLQEADAMGAKPVNQDNRSIWRKGWDFINTPVPNVMKTVNSMIEKPLLPAEQLLDSVLPQGREVSGSLPFLGEMGLTNERLAGGAKTGARLVENLSSPKTLALGAGAGILSGMGSPGLALKMLFSGDMLKNAYQNWNRPDEPGTLPRERIANKGSAIGQGVLAALPFREEGAALARGGAPMRNALALKRWEDWHRSRGAIPTPPPPTVPELLMPKAGDPLTPTPGVRPEPSAAAARPVNPNIGLPQEQQPWWTDYLAAIEKDRAWAEKTRLFEEAKSRRTPPPDQPFAEAPPKPEVPVGELGLASDTPANVAGELSGPPIGTLQPPTNPLPSANQGPGLMKMLKTSGGISVDPVFRKTNTGIRGRKIFEKGPGFKIDIHDANQIVSEFSPFERGKLFKTQGGKIKMDQLKTWAEAQGFTGIRDDAHVIDILRDRATRNITPAQWNSGAGRGVEVSDDAFAEGMAKFQEREARNAPPPKPKWEDFTDADGNIDYAAADAAGLREPGMGGFGDEGGFAVIKDDRLGRKVLPGEFKYGFLGKNGSFYQIDKEHIPGMAEAQGKNPHNYGDNEFMSDMSLNQAIRARKSPRNMIIHAFGKVTPEQRQAIASSAKGIGPTEFQWEVNSKNVKPGTRPYGYGLGDFLRASGGEEGFARIKDDSQKGFDFNSVASEKPKSDNPLLDIVRQTTERPTGIQSVHDDLVKIQNEGRHSAKEDLFKRVMSAPDARVSKRELLGIGKKKPYAPVDPGFLFR
jgi:hypothetical protein